MKVKVQLVSDAKEIGGAEKYIANIVDILRDEIEFHITGGEVLKQVVTAAGGCTTRSISNKAPVKSLVGFVKDFLKIRPDVVHINLTHPLSCVWIQLISLLMRRTRFVATVHLVAPHPKPLLAKFILRHTLRRIYLIFVSQSGVRDIRDFYNCSPRNSTMIPNWVDYDHFHPPNRKQKADARKMLEVKDGQQVGVFIGRFEEQKNILRLVEIAQELCSDDWVFHLVGDGSQRQQIVDEVRERNLEKSVILHSFTDDPRAYYWGADVFFLLSNNECTPLSLLEAMACGVTPIVTDVGDMALMVGTDELVWDRRSSVRECLAVLPNFSSDYWRRRVMTQFSSRFARDTLRDIYMLRV